MTQVQQYLLQEAIPDTWPPPGCPLSGHQLANIYCCGPFSHPSLSSSFNSPPFLSGMTPLLPPILGEPTVSATTARRPLAHDLDPEYYENLQP